MKTISKIFYITFALMLCIFVFSCNKVSVKITNNKMIITEEATLPVEVTNIELSDLTFTYDNTIITVDNEKIHPLKPGKTTILITSGDSDYGTITVIVQPEFDDITLEVGTSYKLVSDELEYVCTTDSDVVSISDSTITALKEGQAMITVTAIDDSEITTTFQVTVSPISQKIVVKELVDGKLQVRNNLQLQFELVGIMIDELIIISDNDCISVSGLTLIPNYAGQANITVSAGNISQTFTAYCLPEVAVTAYVGRAMIIDYLNINNPDDFTIDYDDSIFELENGQLIAKEVGTSQITITSKIHPELQTVVNFEIKSEPIELTGGSELRIGEEKELAFANYDITSFTITNNNPEILSFDGNSYKVIGLKTGTAIFTAVSKNGSVMDFEIKVLPENPIITYDLEEVTVDSWLEFSIENYDDFSEFNYEMDNEIIEIDEDYFGYALAAGIVKITFTHKQYSNVKTTVEIEVLPELVRVRLNAEKIKIGQTFNLELNYQDQSLFTITYNEEVLKYENGTFTAIGIGESIINYTLKSDSRIYDEVEVIVYPIKPFIQVAKTEMTVGQTLRIDVPNYNTNEYILTVSDQTVGTLNGNLFKTTNIGECTITVSLKDNSQETSEVTIAVLPIMPNVQLSSKYLLPNSKSTIFILNYEEVNATSLNDFMITVLDNSIVKYNDDGTITALKVGSTKVIVTLINDSAISKEVDITVCSQNPTSGGEPTQGPLILSLPEDSARVHAGDMVYMSVANATDYEKYTWVSSDSKVAIVNEKGRIIGVEAGMVTVSAYRTDNKDIIGSLTFEVYGIPNVDYIGRLIKIAEAEIGFVEGPDNDTKYGAWYGLNNAAWCAMFVSWCANQAGIGTDIIPKYASVSIGMEWFETRGLFQYKEHYTPKPGDIIIFKSDGASHTGIVIACENGIVYTIEGNTSNMVAKRSYKLDYSQITGYGTPMYPAYDGEVEGGDTGGSSSGEGESTT